MTPRWAAVCDRCAMLVVGAAQLEGEHGLQVLALEQHAIAQAARQALGRLERRFDRDVVDARLEDLLDVVVVHALRIPPGPARYVSKNRRWATARRSLKLRAGSATPHSMDRTRSPTPHLRLRRHRLARHFCHARDPAGAAGHPRPVRDLGQHRAAPGDALDARDRLRQRSGGTAVGPLGPPTGHLLRAVAVSPRKSRRTAGAEHRAPHRRADPAGLRERRRDGRRAGNAHGCVRAGARCERHRLHGHCDPGGADGGANHWRLRRGTRRLATGVRPVPGARHGSVALHDAAHPGDPPARARRRAKAPIRSRATASSSSSGAIVPTRSSARSSSPRCIPSSRARRTSPSTCCTSRRRATDCSSCCRPQPRSRASSPRRAFHGAWERCA